LFALVFTLFALAFGLGFLVRGGDRVESGADSRAGYLGRAADQRLVVPIVPGLRSLNVAVTVAMALGEALRQTGGATGDTSGLRHNAVK
jgi:tRNA (cytidine/uridine-2'-O-)-methyltransferase